MRRLFVLMLLSATTLACQALPIVIAHRGASGYRPEHTQGSYELAIQMGAKFIEPDLVMTKDHVLIVRHENEISQTTDVADKFPARKTRKSIDGFEVQGWFTEDFTLAEIKTLRARERLPFRDHTFDGRFEILTFQEVIALAKKHQVGIVPEVKHPSYFLNIGMDPESALLNDLIATGWNGREAPVIIQSFEPSSLMRLSRQTPLPLVFLMDEADKRPFDHVLANDPRTYGDMMKPAELKNVRAFAAAIGPWKRSIVPEDKEGRLQKPTSLVEDAHAADLKVYPYTFRSDGDFLNKEYGGDPAKEYDQFCKLGVDGLFSDFPDHALKAIQNCTR